MTKTTRCELVFYNKCVNVNELTQQQMKVLQKNH